MRAASSMELRIPGGASPASTPARPISTMDAAKTQGVREPQRNRLLLRPIAYYRHYGPAAWIDPVVLRAITISWNNIVIPVRSCLYQGHPGDGPFPWLTSDVGLLRMRCNTKCPRVTQHQGGSESERYGRYPHAWPPCHTQPGPNPDILRRFDFAPLRVYRTSKAPDPQRLILCRISGLCRISVITVTVHLIMPTTIRGWTAFEPCQLSALSP